MTDDDIEIFDKQVPFKGFFRIEAYKLRHRKFDGSWTAEMRREVFVRGDAVGVLLYDPVKDAVVLVEQFRLPAHLAGRNAWTLEVPAGIVKEGEQAEEVARREVEEETGCRILGPLKKIADFLPSMGGSTETVVLYCGRVDAPESGGIHGLADEHEDIRVAVVPRAEAIRMADEDRLDNVASILALFWLARHWEALRREWSDEGGSAA